MLKVVNHLWLVWSEFLEIVLVFLYSLRFFLLERFLEIPGEFGDSVLQLYYPKLPSTSKKVCVDDRLKKKINIHEPISSQSTEASELF